MLIRTADFDDGQRKKQNRQRILYYDGKQRFCWGLPAKDRLFTGNGGVWRGNLKLKRGKKCVPSNLISFISQFSYFALHLYEVNFEKVMKKKKKNEQINKEKTIIMPLILNVCGHKYVVGATQTHFSPSNWASAVKLSSEKGSKHIYANILHFSPQNAPQCATKW